MDTSTIRTVVAAAAGMGLAAYVIYKIRSASTSTPIPAKVKIVLGYYSEKDKEETKEILGKLQEKLKDLKESLQRHDQNASLDDCEVLVTLQKLACILNKDAGAGARDPDREPGREGGSKDEDKPFRLVMITQEYYANSGSNYNKFGEQLREGLKKCCEGIVDPKLEDTDFQKFGCVNPPLYYTVH